jgi:hypothetical protein
VKRRSDNNFEPSETTRKFKMSDENLEGNKEGHSDVDSPLHSNGPGLPTSAFPRTPDNKTALRKYCLHYHGSNKPTDKSFCGRETMKEKTSGVRNFAWNAIQILY